MRMRLNNRLFLITQYSSVRVTIGFCRHLAACNVVRKVDLLCTCMRWSELALCVAQELG